MNDLDNLENQYDRRNDEDFDVTWDESQIEDYFEEFVIDNYSNELINEEDINNLYEYFRNTWINTNYRNELDVYNDEKED